MSRSQHVQAKSNDGEVTISTQTTDAPLLPVAHLEKLHQFRPDLVDFVVEQTGIEAAYRRKGTLQLNIFIFIERMAGVIAALVIGVAGICAGSYVGLNGQPALGGSIAALSLGTLAIAFLRRKAPEEGNDEESGQDKKPSKRNAPSAKSGTKAIKDT